jgi:hypothetical protein
MQGIMMLRIIGHGQAESGQHRDIEGISDSEEAHFPSSLPQGYKLSSIQLSYAARTKVQALVWPTQVASAA